MPTRGERVFNRIFGALVRLGVGLSHNYLLEVRGRTTGRVYGTPVNVIDVGGRRFLVAGRGRAQWVRNAEVTPDVTLKRGRRREAWTLRPPTAIRSSSSASAATDGQSWRTPMMTSETSTCSPR